MLSCAALTAVLVLRTEFYFSHMHLFITVACSCIYR